MIKYQATQRPSVIVISVIELMHDAKPIRLSTARNIAFGYGEQTKKELHKMVSQELIKPVGDKATE